MDRVYINCKEEQSGKWSIFKHYSFISSEEVVKVYAMKAKKIGGQESPEADTGQSHVSSSSSDSSDSPGNGPEVEVMDSIGLALRRPINAHIPLSHPRLYQRPRRSPRLRLGLSQWAVCATTQPWEGTPFCRCRPSLLCLRFGCRHEEHRGQCSVERDGPHLCSCGGWAKRLEAPPPDPCNPTFIVFSCRTRLQ